MFSLEIANPSKPEEILRKLEYLLAQIFSKSNYTNAIALSKFLMRVYFVCDQLWIMSKVSEILF